jgi:hypothetical protein
MLGKTLALGLAERLGMGVNWRMTSDGLGRGVARDDSHATVLTRTVNAAMKMTSARHGR